MKCLFLSSATKVYMADAQKIWQKLMPEVVTVESHLYRDYT